MDLYLDANATTPVLPAAVEAAVVAMQQHFGNPSSAHAPGRAAQALLAQVRQTARRVLKVPEDGQLVFNSGATEGLQTAVLSALVALRERRAAGDTRVQHLVVGATEHKAVPTALAHWNTLLGLHLPVLTWPVDSTGRHDLAWLRQHAPHAGLVCTMAANNETGVVSDLDGIAAVLAQTSSPALWLVDAVQALGKLPLQLARRPIDYATFSGHKLYAPKGVGLLYVRAGAPFTPLMVGGGQEQGLRAGTENLPGIAALGAVLQALEAADAEDAGHAGAASGGLHHADTLVAHRAQLVHTLRQAFPNVVFNAEPAHSLPTTLNLSLPGALGPLWMQALAAAGLQVSGGSACSAALGVAGSPVLAAMGLPAWQVASAVRLSFGAADSAATIHEACRRLQACGESLQALQRAASGGACKAPAPADHSRPLHLSAEALPSLAATPHRLCLVDLREAQEAEAGDAALLRACLQGAHPNHEPADAVHLQAAPLSGLWQAPSALQAWLALPAGQPLVFVCHSGQRSARVAQLLRELGRPLSFSLAGGVAALRAQHADTANV
ncbi:MAG: aminotransferase class V-fold PLP-dependent enzyme [Rubrivivax sp.]